VDNKGELSINRVSEQRFSAAGQDASRVKVQAKEMGASGVVRTPNSMRKRRAILI